MFFNRIFNVKKTNAVINFRKTYFSPSRVADSVFNQQLSGIKSADFTERVYRAHIVTRETAADPQINLGSNKISKVLSELYDYTCIGGRYNRTKLMLHTYEKLMDSTDLTDENIMLASIVGYASDVLTSSFLIVDDILDNAEIRRNKPSWFKKVGIKSALDPILMNNAINLSFKHFLERRPCYIPLIQLFNQVSWTICNGILLDSYTLDIFGSNINNYSWENYKRHCFSEMTTSAYYLPIVSAMLLAGHDHSSYKENFMDIIDSMAYYITVTNDYNDSYKSSQNTGKVMNEDIQCGKLTWLLLTAMELATPEQQTVLKKSYGKRNQEDIETVLQLYDDLQIPEKYSQFETSLKHSISNNIMSRSFILDERVQEILMYALNLSELWYNDLP